MILSGLTMNMKTNQTSKKENIQNIIQKTLYLTSGIYHYFRRHLSTLRNELRRHNYYSEKEISFSLSQSSSDSKEQQKALLDKKHKKSEGHWNKSHYLNNYRTINYENKHDNVRLILTNILVILLFAIVICILLLFASYFIANWYDFQTNHEQDNETDRFEITKHRQNSGIHVIVGQFLGRGYPWNSEPNITSDERNTNGYAPLPGAGENGTPVYVPPPLRSRATQFFFVNRFNLIASDMISVNRSLPDARKLACRKIHYPSADSLPNTSVIIVFHNEAWSTLVRTVHSVINRSQFKLLTEIILVDDASNRTFLGSKLNSYFENLSYNSRISIHLIRSRNRIGLINARILGAKKAKGEVLTFLDAHVEVTIGWLEPLLNRIREDPKTVICPVIDIINDQTFAYAKSFDLHWGAMNWALNFRWFSVGKREVKALRIKQATAPFRTPIMAGGLFSIDRKYFFDMGKYDEQQRIWGGENIEMSLRIWQCGGRVEIAPCSHVAHLFRSSSPYSFGSKNDDKVANVLFRNLIRVVDVWLDEWKHFYYRLNPSAYQFLISSANKSEIFENIDERHALRKRLKCKSFSWYLNNVWPESFFPTYSRLFGQLKSLSSGNCIQSSGTGRNPTGKLKMFQCNIEPYTPQIFVLPPLVRESDSKDLKPPIEDYIRSDESVCFDSSDPQEGSSVSLIACGEFRRQLWTLEYLDSHFQDALRIRHVKSRLCLSLDKHSTFLILEKCLIKSRKQQWIVIDFPWNKTL